VSRREILPTKLCDQCDWLHREIDGTPSCSLYDIGELPKDPEEMWVRVRAGFRVRPKTSCPKFLPAESDVRLVVRK